MIPLVIAAALGAASVKIFENREVIKTNVKLFKNKFQSFSAKQFLKRQAKFDREIADTIEDIAAFIADDPAMDKRIVAASDELKTAIFESKLGR